VATALLTTANETVEEPVEKPPFERLPETAGSLGLLGTVDSIISKVVVVKAAAPGHSQVLDAGTLVCLPDRRCLGFVAETFGPINAPCYLIRFDSADDPLLKPTVIAKGSPLYYPSNPHFATLLNTQQIKAQSKPSDASNIHDEEVGANDMEFSDDEAEAAYRKSLKQARQGSPRQALASGSRSMDHFADHYAGHFKQGHSKQEADVLQRIDNDLEYTPLQRPASPPSDMAIPGIAAQTASGTRDRSEEPRRSDDHAEGTPPVPTQPRAEYRKGQGADRGRGNARGKNKRGRGAGAAQDRGQPWKDSKPYIQDQRKAPQQYQRPPASQALPPRPAGLPNRPQGGAAYARPSGNAGESYRPPYLPTAPPSQPSYASYVDDGYDPISPASGSYPRQQASEPYYPPYVPQQYEPPWSLPSFAAPMAAQMAYSPQSYYAPGHVQVAHQPPHQQANYSPLSPSLSASPGLPPSPNRQGHLRR
jgi:H/ACA ribonucleoprotein complex non-core subunit NAF1